MEHSTKFSFIRKALQAIGLSSEAVDDIIDRISELSFR